MSCETVAGCHAKPWPDVMRNHGRMSCETVAGCVRISTHGLAVPMPFNFGIRDYTDFGYRINFLCVASGFQTEKLT